MNIRPNMPATLLPIPPGTERRLWTVDDLRRLEDAGILRHDERVELIAGEIIRMSPKGIRHEVLRNELVLAWARRLPADVKFAEEPPLTLHDNYQPEPDIVLFPASLRVHQARADTVLLVVEIADSSLKWDLDTKSKAYALFGVRDYWVVNARTLETTIHREPSEAGYASIVTIQRDAILTPLAAPQLAICIGELPVADIE